MSMTIHEMPAALFDAWEQALGGVPDEVSLWHHERGLYLDKPIGTVVYENHRVSDRAQAEAGVHTLKVRGLTFTRGPA